MKTLAGPISTALVASIGAIMAGLFSAPVAHATEGGIYGVTPDWGGWEAPCYSP